MIFGKKKPVRRQNRSRSRKQRGQVLSQSPRRPRRVQKSQEIDMRKLRQFINIIANIKVRNTKRMGHLEARTNSTSVYNLA